MPDQSELRQHLSEFGVRADNQLLLELVRVLDRDEMPLDGADVLSNGRGWHQHTALLILSIARALVLRKEGIRKPSVHVQSLSWPEVRVVEANDYGRYSGLSIRPYDDRPHIGVTVDNRGTFERVYERAAALAAMTSDRPVRSLMMEVADISLRCQVCNRSLSALTKFCPHCGELIGDRGGRSPQIEDVEIPIGTRWGSSYFPGHIRFIEMMREHERAEIVRKFDWALRQGLEQYSSSGWQPGHDTSLLYLSLNGKITYEDTTSFLMSMIETTIDGQYFKNGTFLSARIQLRRTP